MGSKVSKDAKQDKEIKYDFDRFGSKNFDNFFEKVSDLLRSAEDMRSGFYNNREKGAELTGTHLLQDSKCSDIVQVLFWTLSAENGGSIKATGLNTTDETPFLKLDENKCQPDTWDIYQTFCGYSKAVMDGPQTVQEVIDKLQILVDMLPTVTPEFKAEIHNSFLGLRDKTKALSLLRDYNARLPKELAKCKDLSTALRQAKVDLQELLTKLDELIETADEIGTMAHTDGLKKATEIFAKYHLGPRNSEGTEKKKDNKKRKDEKKDNKDKDFMTNNSSRSTIQTTFLGTEDVV